MTFTLPIYTRGHTTLIKLKNDFRPSLQSKIVAKSLREMPPVPEGSCNVGLGFPFASVYKYMEIIFQLIDLLMQVHV